MRKIETVAYDPKEILCSRYSVISRGGFVQSLYISRSKSNLYISRSWTYTICPGSFILLSKVTKRQLA